jgi:hypothetical protein
MNDVSFFIAMLRRNDAVPEHSPSSLPLSQSHYKLLKDSSVEAHGINEKRIRIELKWALGLFLVISSWTVGLLIDPVNNSMRPP